MKKRFVLVLMLLAAVIALTACGKKENAAIADTVSKVPTVINQSEYVLYQNIFYNNYGPQFDGKSVTKRGIFTTVQDAYSNVTRYYVWGNLDQTLCCDWQWELKIDDPSNLPANGSLISVTGKFVSNESALDGYWITEPRIEVQSAYVGTTADLDMTTMSGTLERVQVLNYTKFPEQFEGKTVFAYGRINDVVSIQDPYYDGSWVASIATSENVPAIGTSVVVRGVMKDGVISDAKIEVTST